MNNYQSVEPKIEKEIQRIEGKTPIEVADFTPLHPSLDIKNNILVVGFRILGKDRELKNLFLVIKGKNEVELTLEKEHWVGEQKFYIDLGKRLLEPLEERWGFAEINAFGQNPGGKPEETFKKLRSLCQKYLELGEQADYTLITAWVIGTYFFRIFWTFPFLHIKAPKQSGKSQLLGFLLRTCLNAKKARPTVAALSDTVDALRGTYLVDQADGLSNGKNEEILEIFADSYKREGGRRRLVERAENGQRRVIEFETYSPKAFASIRELPEDLRDRCVIVPLIKSNHNFPEPDEQNEDWRKIRGELYGLLPDFKEVIEIYQNLKKKYENSDLVGRVRELWLPLETIMTFSRVSQDEIEKAKKLYLSRYGYATYEPSELEEEVVKTVLDQFEDKTEMILTPKGIGGLMDLAVFPDQDTPAQRAANIGRAIRKFNLSSEKLPRTKEGMRYLFKKEKVEQVYNSYFKSLSEPMPSYAKPENGLDVNGLEM